MWFRVDDKLWGSPKWTSLKAGPRALWVTAGAYSMDQLTDGFIPTHVLPILGGRDSDAVALVKAELWEQDAGGYRFHDWSDYQPSREDVLGKREAEAARKAKWRAEKAERAAQRAASESSPPDVPPVSQRDKSVSPAPVPDVSRSSRPDPTRPDPTRGSSNEEPRQEHAAPPTADAAQRPERIATTNAYERTGKALKFMAVEGIAKWAIHTRGTDPQVVEDAIVAIYELGKPVTKSVMGQYLDGHIGRPRTTDHARDILAAELSANRQIGAS